MKTEIEVITQFIDYLLPELTPYETTFYLYLLRHTLLTDEPECRVGKRSLALVCGKTARGTSTSYQQVTQVLKGLEVKNCIRIHDTNRDGTLYQVVLPEDIPLVREKLAEEEACVEAEDDYYNDPEKRLEIFERDNWTCQYCFEQVDKDNCTLDHFIPQSKGGGHGKENLRTCCLTCNSLKSGKLYDEAAPLILKSIGERRQRR